MASVPAAIGGAPVAVRGMNGADLLSLLEPANPDVQAALPGILDFLASQGKTPADLALAFGSVVNAEGQAASITAELLPGVAPADLATAMQPLLAKQYAPAQTAAASVGGKQTTRVSTKPFAKGDSATYLYPQSDTLWSVAATPPQLGAIFKALP